MGSGTVLYCNDNMISEVHNKRHIHRCLLEWATLNPNFQHSSTKQSRLALQRTNLMGILYVVCSGRSSITVITGSIKYSTNAPQRNNLICVFYMFRRTQSLGHSRVDLLDEHVPSYRNDTTLMITYIVFFQQTNGLGTFDWFTIRFTILTTSRLKSDDPNACGNRWPGPSASFFRYCSTVQYQPLSLTPIYRQRIIGSISNKMPNDFCNENEIQAFRSVDECLVRSAVRLSGCGMWHSNAEN